MIGVGEAQLVELLYLQGVNNGPTSSWKGVFLRVERFTVVFC